MKKLVLIAIALFSISYTFAQPEEWNGNTSGQLTTSTTVGIGTYNTNNGVLTINSSNSTNMLRLENEGHGNESTLRFRARSVTGQLLHGDVSLYSTGLNSGYLGFKVPASNTTNGDYDMIINQEGNIGMGTLDPFGSTNNYGIQIARGTHSSLLVGSPNTSNYGGIIQTSDGRHRIFIGANYYDDGTDSWKNFQSGKGSAGISLYADEGQWGTSIDFLTSQADGNSIKRMSIKGNGNIGIGTTNPDAKLAVNGQVHSQEVLVDMDGWSDFVFADDYHLQSLEKVEEFINENSHLPEIPSEAEVLKNGIKLGEMDAKLLQKIEELTLYLIEQNKEIQSLKKELTTLKRK
ncbi:MAG: hypothetical protein AAFQ94_21965 [Bacteroidota bacterium]